VAERRLRDAFQISQLLLQHEAGTTIQAWFTGMNPELDDQSPALMLAKHPQEVLIAARNFLANG
jgi:hypothetical protein